MRRVIRGQWSVVSRVGRWVGIVAVLLFVGVLGAQEDRGQQGVRFVPVDVVVDSGGVGLGAWQVEVKALEGVKVVGVEGGEGVFGEAPFYDPTALQDGERIVVAAFSTEEAGKLPRGNVRVGRLHLMARGVGNAGIEKMPSRLVVATDGDGKSIAATLSLRVTQGEK